MCATPFGEPVVPLVYRSAATGEEEGDEDEAANERSSGSSSGGSEGPRVPASSTRGTRSIARAPASRIASWISRRSSSLAAFSFSFSISFSSSSGGGTSANTFAPESRRTCAISARGRPRATGTTIAPHIHTAWHATMNSGPGAAAAGARARRRGFLLSSASGATGGAPGGASGNATEASSVGVVVVVVVVARVVVQGARVRVTASGRARGGVAGDGARVVVVRVRGRRLVGRHRRGCRAEALRERARGAEDGAVRDLRARGVTTATARGSARATSRSARPKPRRDASS